jgi:hypothetical protein
MSKRDVQHLLVLRRKQLKVATNDLPSVAKKKVVAAMTLVSSTEAFPTRGACLPTGGAHGSGDQFPWPEGGGGVLKLWPGRSAGGGGG